MVSKSRTMDKHRHTILGLRDDAARKRDAAQERAYKARREAETHQAQVDAYNKALNALGEEAGEIPSTHPKPSYHESTKVSRATPKRRTLSPKWIEIYRTLYLTAEPPYSYDDLNTAIILTGNEATDGSQRTQMMNAVNGGNFRRVGTGLFDFTETGLKRIGVSTKEKGPDDNTSEPSPVTGEVGASPDESRGFLD